MYKTYTSPGLLQCEIPKSPVLEKALSASLLLSVSGTGFWARSGKQPEQPPSLHLNYVLFRIFLL